MAMGVSTIIIEPRFLVREALVSLMGKHSYRVVSGVASTKDIVSSIVADAPELVILGALPAEDVARNADSIRKLWPETKIVLLVEHASAADFHQLLVSEIDGCVPLFVSPDTLIRTLELILVEDLRILVGASNHPSMPRAAQLEEATIRFEASQNRLGSLVVDNVPLPAVRLPIEDPAGRYARNGDSRNVPSRCGRQGLSEREGQILKDLVKGHSNKRIARTWAVAEATVKVHMKSILRKIHVANRTQAAIWALEHGYCDGDFDDQSERAGHTGRRGAPSLKQSASNAGHGVPLTP
jgi:two-component system, NarL family, nitrate/nitrite response regulator NarL